MTQAVTWRFSPLVHLSCKIVCLIQVFLRLFIQLSSYSHVVSVVVYLGSLITSDTQTDTHTKAELPLKAGLPPEAGLPPKLDCHMKLDCYTKLDCRSMLDCHRLTILYQISRCKAHFSHFRNQLINLFNKRKLMKLVPLFHY